MNESKVITARSFLLYTGNTIEGHATARERLEPACLRLFPHSQNISSEFTEGIWIGINGQGNTTAAYSPVSNSDVWIFNDDSPGLAELCFQSYEEFGIEGLKELHISGVVIFRNGNRLYIFNGDLGVTPILYAFNGKDVLISTEIKALAGQDILPLSMAPAEAFRPIPYFKADGFCPVDGVSRLKAGAILEVDLAGNICNVIPGHSRKVCRHSSVGESRKILYEQLDDLIRQNIGDSRIGIPLSGGFDSGAIAGIANNYTDLRTFTMGTEEINEFKGARKMSEFIASEHHEFVIPEDELVPAILHGIFLNEFTDPMYAEGYSGLYFIFRESQEMVDTLFTGYGADLSLGNLLECPLEELNENSEMMIRRTSWTGELTNYAPSFFGLKVIQPFLDSSIVDHILSMPYNYKVRNGVEKFIEKEMIIRHGLMPSELLDVRKRALHTGAGIDKLFNKILGINNDEDYIIKSNFLFYAWKELIFNNVTASNADIDELVYKTKRASTGR